VDLDLKLLNKMKKIKCVYVAIKLFNAITQTISSIIKRKKSFSYIKKYLRNCKTKNYHYKKNLINASFNNYYMIFKAIIINLVEFDLCIKITKI